MSLVNDLMLPILMVGILLMATLAAYAPVSVRLIRRLGSTFIAIASGLAIYIAWPGFTQPHIFGPWSLWYVDGVSSMLMVLVAMIGLSSVLITQGHWTREPASQMHSTGHNKHCYTLTPLLLAALYVVVLSNNLGVMWLAFGLAALTTTMLVANQRQLSALAAARRYGLTYALGLSLALIGMLLMTYAVELNDVNSWLLLSNFREMAITQALNNELIKWAFVFLFVGFGTLVGFVPMHAWVADVQREAPAPLAAILSSVILSVALVSLLRFYQVVNLALMDEGMWTGRFFLVFGCLSVVFSAMILGLQNNYKRLLAYSSCVHLGLTAFAIGLGPAGLIPAVMHIPGHALLMSALFIGTDETYKGHKSAVLILLTVLLLLAVPPSALFTSQLLIIGLGLGQHLVLTILVLLSLTIGYVSLLRYAYNLLFGIGRNANLNVAGQPMSTTHVVMTMHIALVVALGIFYLTPSGLEFMVQISDSLRAV